jgi:hypothetical protein
MATGKLGYAWDGLLLYGKGGGAWVGTSSPGDLFGALLLRQRICISLRIGLTNLSKQAKDS